MNRQRDFGRIAAVRHARLQRTETAMAKTAPRLRAEEAGAADAQALLDSHQADSNDRVSHFLETMMGAPVTRHAIDIEQDRLMLDDLEQERLARLRLEALGRVKEMRGTLAGLRHQRDALQRSCDGIAHVLRAFAREADLREAAIEECEMEDIGVARMAIPC